MVKEMRFGKEIQLPVDPEEKNSHLYKFRTIESPVKVFYKFIYQGKYPPVKPVQRGRKIKKVEEVSDDDDDDDEYVEEVVEVHYSPSKKNKNSILLIFQRVFHQLDIEI